jgi:hypothetical protein
MWGILNSIVNDYEFPLSRFTSYKTTVYRLRFGRISMVT